MSFTINTLITALYLVIGMHTIKMYQISHYGYWVYAILERHYIGMCCTAGLVSSILWSRCHCICSTTKCSTESVEELCTSYATADGMIV